jgi:hypothetical protein
MVDYQLTAPAEPCIVIRKSDGANIPPDPANRDYAEYLSWKALGNVPDPYVQPPPPPPVKDANARIDAGVMAALDVAVAVKLAMREIPDNFTEQNVVAAKIQLDALTEAVVAMLQAQANT